MTAKVPQVKAGQQITARGENRVRDAVNTLIGSIGSPNAPQGTPTPTTVEAAADPDETADTFPAVYLESKVTEEKTFPIYDLADPEVQIGSGIYVATVALIYNIDGESVRIDTD